MSWCSALNFIEALHKFGIYDNGYDTPTVVMILFPFHQYTLNPRHARTLDHQTGSPSSHNHRTTYARGLCASTLPDLHIQTFGLDAFFHIPEIPPVDHLIDAGNGYFPRHPFTHASEPVMAGFESEADFREMYLQARGSSKMDEGADERSNSKTGELNDDGFKYVRVLF